MASKLYLVRGHDVDGENQDLFVVAHDRDAAVEIWNDTCVDQMWPRHDGDEEASPRGTTTEPSNVREILPDVTGTTHDGPDRAIDWDALPFA